jgi:hypothetical protein
MTDDFAASKTSSTNVELCRVNAVAQFYVSRLTWQNKENGHYNYNNVSIQMNKKRRIVNSVSVIFDKLYIFLNVDIYL